MLQEQTRIPTTNETNDVALFYFDVVLLMLAASFDVVARVAHRVYELPVEAHWPNWRTKWRSKTLARADSDLAQLMASGEPARDALEMVALPRNSIHAAALRGVTFRRRGRLQETRVEVPRSIEERLFTSAERLADADEWGFHASGRSTYIEPGQYVESVLVQSAGALNDLMMATRVERLGAGEVPPEPPEDHPWDLANRTRHRLFAGV